IKATIEVVEPLGAETVIIASVDGDQNLVARLDARVMLKAGDQVELLANPAKLQAFDLDNELNIRFS
ncbi:TOBE domain-containing protein, partial [Klebsiella pneumoniae]|uniref:TOBE domain-containing protein n=1 Tax=Klebsiella pneumoniae TaxID=573 RepID=UPI00226D8BB0